MDKLLSQPEVVAAIIGAVVGGIIGILGSLSTIIITALIKNWGKLSVFINESKLRYTKLDQMGGEKIIENINEAETIEIDITVDIYNDSNKSKTLGNFRVELRENRQNKTFPVKQHFRTPGGVPYSLSVPSQTILPKQPISIKCKTFLQKADIACFNKNIDVYFLANTPKHQSFKSKILSIDKG